MSTRKFMAVYTGTADAYEKWLRQYPDPDKQKAQQDAGIAAWGAWNAALGGAILDVGGPLGKTKAVSAAGIEDARNSLTGYAIVQAQSHEAAAELFRNHPHFTVFPGDAVEIMEILPIPRD